MKIVRFAAAPDGGSQFVEIDFPVDNASTDAWGHTARRSAVVPAQSTMVTEMPEGLYQEVAPVLAASAVGCVFRHTGGRNQRREEAPMQQRGSVSG
jgi:hypothetical protein